LNLKYSDDVYERGELSGLRKKMSYIALKLKDPAEHSPSSPPAGDTALNGDVLKFVKPHNS
jgi:hypothetical protein